MSSQTVTVVLAYLINC